MCYFISTYFTIYSSFLECSLNFIFKHVGIILSLYIFYVYISLGYELGITDEIDIEKRFEYNNSIMKTSINYNNFSKTCKSSNDETAILKSTPKNIKDSVINNNCVFENYKNNKIIKSEMTNSNTEENSYNIVSVSQETKILENSLSENSNINKNGNNNNNNNNNKNNNSSNDNGNSNNNNNDNIKKNNEGKSLMYNTSNTKCYNEYNGNQNDINSNNENEDQSENGEWFYQCNVDTPNIIYNTFELLAIVVILLKGKYVLSMDCVFEVTKYITYSSILAIFIGPSIQVRNNTK
ncbi:hypothetical protein PIROE2DRAFT_5452 [Piromyces sp. E2]|nr:hypothetical protein PIROE2DRAFT_5452 [Piromyces sp. E2]|eukprot:OUM67184.1 hypothetical protein PIROE2DRAFT_5452 [Piromyces sp. E2]